MIFFELFYVFFYIGILTFGGGYAMIPMIQDEVVSRGWLEASSLTNFIAISESTPGPFAINIATFIGAQRAGFFGAVCSTLGVILPSFIIIIIVSLIMRKFLSNKYVKGSLKGVRGIIIALILSTAIMFFLKMGFFSNASIKSSNFYFDRASLTILLILFIIMFGYKFIKKKSLNPITLLGLSAVLGMIVFGI